MDRGKEMKEIEEGIEKVVRETEVRGREGREGEGEERCREEGQERSERK